MKYAAFTLIELLIVIAIIAVLAVVTILVLNPSQILRQTRDSQRLSDLAQFTNALGVYGAQGGSSLGTAGIIYISIPDPTATSTLGTNCSGIGLSGNYHCPASSTYRRTDGTGWIPIDLTVLDIDPPLTALPVDPTNTTSSGCYAYETDGVRWEIAASPESDKYTTQATSSFLGGTSKDLIPQGVCPIFAYGFAKTGAVAAWTVPSRVTNCTITALGSGGGSAAGGAGGIATGTLSVVPGTKYYLNVGGSGLISTAGGAGGYGGGGNGYNGGGGMTWFGTANTFSTTSVLLVAAGGGGADTNGGAGGGLIGINGSGNNGYYGYGGTQTAGGSGYGSGSGSAGIGGSGNGGGGGGGYYGGGAGDDDTYFAGGGGGGSSYLSPILTAATTTAGGGGAHDTNGSMTIVCR